MTDGDAFDSQVEHPLTCAGCKAEFDAVQDTHYRVDEEERPVAQLEKDPEELEFDDFTSRGWFVCESCISQVVEV